MSPINAPALMILDEYGAEDRSGLSLLGSFRSTMLGPLNVPNIGIVAFRTRISARSTARRLRQRLVVFFLAAATCFSTASRSSRLKSR